MALLGGTQLSGRSLGTSEQTQLVQLMTQLQAAGAPGDVGGGAGVHPAFPWPLPTSPLASGQCFYISSQANFLIFEFSNH